MAGESLYSAPLTTGEALETCRRRCLTLVTPSSWLRSVRSPVIESGLARFTHSLEISKITGESFQHSVVVNLLTLRSGYDQSGAVPTRIPVNYGIGHPSPYLVANPLSAQTWQAILFGNLPKNWTWSAANRVNFICHSQGGTTLRYLVELMSGTHNAIHPNFPVINCQNWIKSVVTLGTPHKGTTVTDVVQVRGLSHSLLARQLQINAIYGGLLIRKFAGAASTEPHPSHQSYCPPCGIGIVQIARIQILRSSVGSLGLFQTTCA